MQEDYFLCETCHQKAIKKAICICSTTVCTNLCGEKVVCSHKPTKKLSSLTPISLGLVGVINVPNTNNSQVSKKKRQVFLEKIFVGANCIKDFYNFLQENSKDFLEIQNPSVPLEANRYRYSTILKLISLL